MAGEKILIVEDNPLNLELATDLLELAGYVVIQAETAEKGIELAKSHMPDLILMDISLPGMDGLAAIEILKQDDTTENIPIVVMTAHTMKGDKEKILASGCESTITKPINTRTFPETVACFIKSSMK